MTAHLDVDNFLLVRTGNWESTLAEDGPPVRFDLPAVLQRLRRPS